MTIQEQIVAARVAQAAIKDYTQEQIDKLVYEVAKIIYKNAEPLAREAVDETRLGCYEDKIAKNTDTPATFWAYLKDKKSVGIISEDAVSGVMEIAHPIGVIGAITPATNPTVTPLGNFMHALKGKNALVVCPAPRAQKTSTDTINLMRQALVANGAPADLVQAVEEPTLEHSAQLMAECDLVLATGAFGLTNTNRLVRFYDGATGLKTGFTASAQYCMSAAAQRNGMELIAVVMKAPTTAQRFQDASSLLDYGFANYALITPQPESPLAPVDVLLGRSKTVQPQLQRECHLLVEKTQADQVTTRVDLAQDVQAPVDPGQTLGEFQVYVGNELRDSVPIVAAQGVDRLSVPGLFSQLLRRLLFAG